MLSTVAVAPGADGSPWTLWNLLALLFLEGSGVTRSSDLRFLWDQGVLDRERRRELDRLGFRGGDFELQRCRILESMLLALDNSRTLLVSAGFFSLSLLLFFLPPEPDSDRFAAAAAAFFFLAFELDVLLLRCFAFALLLDLDREVFRFLLPFSASLAVFFGSCERDREALGFASAFFASASASEVLTRAPPKPLLVPA